MLRNHNSFECPASVIRAVKGLKGSRLDNLIGLTACGKSIEGSLE